MKKIVEKIIIISFLICFFCMNNLIAAPYTYYPKKYVVTINNINKISIEKIEVLIVCGSKYETKDTINRKDIQQRLKGINIVLSDIDSPIYLRIWMKNGEYIMTDKIDYSSAMMVDEFTASNEKYVEEAKKSAEKTVHFIGEYNSSNSKIKIKSSNFIISRVENPPMSIAILISGIIVFFIFKIILRSRKKKENKQTKNLE